MLKLEGWTSAVYTEFSKGSGLCYLVPAGKRNMDNFVRMDTSFKKDPFIFYTNI